MELASWRVPLPPGSAHVAVAPFRRMVMLSRLTEPRRSDNNRESRRGKMANNRHEMVIQLSQRAMKLGMITVHYKS
jgi:hypothetical protein